MEGLESSRESSADQIAERLFHNRRRCCFHFSPPSVDLKWSIWGRSVTVLKKVREWSEIVAGPRWKTFIRRFNRNRSGGNKQVNNNNNNNFQYDALSYAMNFDEGQNGNFNNQEEDNEDYSRNFSSRYANGSMDDHKDGPAAGFV